MPRTFIIALLSLLCTCVSAQELSFFESFTDHAVLQRDVEHPVWGWVKPGRKVTLTFDGAQMTAKADKTGRWQIMLPAQPAGGPHEMYVASGRRYTKSITDVYFGDVYLLSGQSNMEWRLVQSDTSGERAAKIADPMIRELKVNKSHASAPGAHLPLDTNFGDAWLVGGDAKTIGEFSGVGSYFAHYLRKEVDVPIGLLHSSWGGSRIEPWMSPEALGVDTQAALKENEDVMTAAGREGRATYREAFPGQEPPTEDWGEELGWLTADFDDSAWPSMNLPIQWESAGYPFIDGYFYFRRAFTLTAEQATGPATLYLGAIDDGDWTYINGTKVGSTPNSYTTERVYEIPAGVLQAGENKMAVKVFDNIGGGGFSNDAAQVYLETEAGRVPMAGSYKYNVGEFKVDGSPNQVPTILYNSMIAPLEGMPLAGVLWYQGESNSGNGDNVKYAELMRGLVRQWRGFFSHGDTLPFYWVQLANFMEPVAAPDEDGWAVIRESQTQALDLPKTGMAVITDIGEADDIHPKNKWEVGRRLSLLALRDVYGKDLTASSPMVSGVSFENDNTTALVSFDNVAAGLRAMGEDRYSIIKGFTVRDTAGEWHFAPAVIVGEDQVRVLAPRGVAIDRVRYNWANNPDGNLFSSEGLPANAFDHSNSK